MISFNLTALLVFISFLGFMFLMKALYFDPIANIKAKREEKLFDDQAKVDEAAKSLRYMREDYDAQLREARKKAQEQILQISQDAKAKASELLAETRQQVRNDLDNNLNELSAWREETYRQLGEKRQELKRLILEKITSSQTIGAERSSVNSH